MQERQRQNQQDQAAGPHINWERVDFAADYVPAERQGGAPGETLETRKLHKDNLVINFIPQNAATSVTFGLLLDDESPVMQHYRNMLLRLLPGWTTGDNVNSVFAPFGKRGDMSTRMTYSLHPPHGGGVLPSKEALDEFIKAFPWWKKDLQVIAQAIEAARETVEVPASTGIVTVAELKEAEETFIVKLRGGPLLDRVYAENKEAVIKAAKENPEGKEAVFIEARDIADLVEQHGKCDPDRWKAFLARYAKLDIPARRQISIGILGDVNLLTDHHVSGSAFSETHPIWRPKWAERGGQALWALGTIIPLAAGWGVSGVALGVGAASILAAGWLYYSYQRLSDYAIEVAKGAVEPYPVVAALRVVRHSLRAWEVARYETERIPTEPEGVIDNSPRKLATQYMDRAGIRSRLAGLSPEQTEDEKERIFKKIIREEKLDIYDIMFDKRFGDTFSQRDDAVHLRNKIVYEESKVFGVYSTLIQSPMFRNSKAWFGYKYQAISELTKSVEGTQLRWSRFNEVEKFQNKMAIQKEIEGMSGLGLAFGLLKAKNPVTFVAGVVGAGLVTLGAMALAS